MEVTYRKIAEGRQVLEEMLRMRMDQFPDPELPFLLAETVEALGPHLRAYQRLQRKLFTEMSEEPEEEEGKKGEPQVPDEKLDEFNTRHDELLAQVVDINIKPIWSSEFKKRKLDGFLTPRHLAALPFLFKRQEKK